MTTSTAAKRRIASGKSEIASYVKSLPANLKNVGADAAKEIGDKFEQLESDVNSKQESVVDTLASKYVEARKGLDDRIEELQAENKGLVDKAIGAIKAVINTIRQLAAMLMNTLARVAHVVGDIIKHPVRFLGNLVEGVKGGILRFKNNILDHLRKGLMGWLFGALAEGGVEVPDKFDLQGIIKLLLSLFGLTWTNIRNRIVKQIGEKAMGAIEKGVDIFQKIASGGVAALWQMLIDKLGDIKEMIMSQVKDFVVTKIITAGITWLIGLLNPAAAFIKACKLIYDIIMFFVTNGERIMKFVNTVIDSAVDIIGGNIGGVVAKIEDVLGQMVPILIGFLASVIGIGGIGEKIREILGKLQKPVNKAIDFVIKTGLKIAGPIIRAVKGIAGKVKAGFAKGKAWVKGKVEAGKQWVKGKMTGRKKVEPGKQQTPRQMEAAAMAAAKDGYRALSKGVSPAGAAAALQSVLGRHKAYGVKSLELVGASDGLHVKASVNPTPVYHKGMRVTIGPLSWVRPITEGEEGQVGGMTSEHAVSKTDDDGDRTLSLQPPRLRVRTHDQQRGEVPRDATRSAQGAHAEEQLTNAFEEIYNEVLGQRKRKESGAPQAFNIEMGINVSVSSCPNCATHIANFMQRMRADGCTVTARMRFGALYHGPNARSPEPRVVMPEAIVGRTDPAGKVLQGRHDQAGQRRPHLGLAGPVDEAARAAEGLQRACPRVRRLESTGCAILRTAGVQVDLLETDETKLKPEERRSSPTDEPSSKRRWRR